MGEKPKSGVSIRNVFIFSRKDDMDTRKTEMMDIFMNFYDDPFKYINYDKAESIVATDNQITTSLASLYPHSTRDQSIADLYKLKDGASSQFALLLWNSYGCLAILIYELSSLFMYTVTPGPSFAYYKKICKVLAILCVLTHAGDISKEFTKANFHCYMQVLLRKRECSVEYEYVRIGCIWLMYSGLAYNNIEDSQLALKKYLIPACIYLCNNGRSLTKIASLNIMQKLLGNKIGIEVLALSPEIFDDFICCMAEIMNNMSEDPDELIIKHLMACYKLIFKQELLVRLLIKNFKLNGIMENINKHNQSKEFNVDETRLVIEEIERLRQLTESYSSA